MANAHPTEHSHFTGLLGSVSGTKMVNINIDNCVAMTLVTATVWTLPVFK